MPYFYLPFSSSLFQSIKNIRGILKSFFFQKEVLNFDFNRGLSSFMYVLCMLCVFMQFCKCVIYCNFVICKCVFIYCYSVTCKCVFYCNFVEKMVYVCSVLLINSCEFVYVCTLKIFVCSIYVCDQCVYVCVCDQCVCDQSVCVCVCVLKCVGGSLKSTLFQSANSFEII